jgi:hypothetical protein
MNKVVRWFWSRRKVLLGVGLGYLALELIAAVLVVAGVLALT